MMIENVVKLVDRCYLLELILMLTGKEQYVLVDMVSNLAGGGWTVVTDAGTYGQSGLIPWYG